MDTLGAGLWAENHGRSAGAVADLPNVFSSECVNMCPEDLRWTILCDTAW